MDEDGYSSLAGCGTARDCNDDDPFTFPGAPERCDGVDSDCNGFVDDDPACDRTCDAPQRFPTVTQVTNSGDKRAEEMDLVWVGDGWIATYWRAWSGSCEWIELQKLDMRGTRVGEPVIVSGGDGVELYTHRPRLAWTGRELGIVWEEAPTPSGNPCTGWDAVGLNIYFRRYDRALRPLGGRIRLGCLDFTDEMLGDIAWNGRVFGVVWTTEFGLRITTVDRQDVAAQPCGVPFTSEEFENFPRLAWSGGEFGAAWRASPTSSEYAEIYFRRFGEDGSLPDPAPTRLTFQPNRSDMPFVAWADGEWGISWADERDNPSLRTHEIYFMRLDGGGTKLEPPGDIRATCCQDALFGPHRYFSSLVWTGEEYGLAYDEKVQSQGFTRGDIFFQRLSRQGTNVGAPVLLTPEPTKAAYQVALGWNGRQYGVAYADSVGSVTEPQVYFARVGCNCADLDGDMFSSCAGNDCDDTNPLVNPIRSETCLNGLDDNCDGKTDCQDAAACPAGGGAPPGEVQGLAIGADKRTWTWLPESGSQRYDLLTGDLGYLREDGGYGRARCLAWRVAGTSFDDPEMPVQRRGTYVVVRGKADTCKLGTWGSVLRDQAATTCP